MAALRGAEKKTSSGCDEVWQSIAFEPNTKTELAGIDRCIPYKL